jgi:CRISPR-associated protein Cas4
MTDDAPELELVPARMLDEYVYCPRLAFIEWVEGDFEDNRFTAEGRFQHRRVDREGGRLADPPAGDSAGAEPERLHGRSVHLSAPLAGLVARIDLVEAEGRAATPVDYKRGAPPDRPERCHEPERVQLCAQALILEEHGFECRQGVLYFAGARQRVEVPITDELRVRTLAAAADLRVLARSGQLPPPLAASPKCIGCSLAPVCLPDEIGFLARAGGDPPRQLFAARDDALPLRSRTPSEHRARARDPQPRSCGPIEARSWSGSTADAQEARSAASELRPH